jgi:hypothetical protein
MAAHRAGMLPVLIPDLKAPSADALALAFRVFRTLTEVRRFFSGELPGYDARRRSICNFFARRNSF